MAMGADDKTESATPKRRGDERKKGRVPKSTELSGILVLMGVFMVLRAFIGAAGQITSNYFIQIFSHLDEVHITAHDTMRIGAAAFMTIFRSVGPIMVTAMILGIFANVVQTGPMISGEALQPNFKRLNPVNGLKKFVSPEGLVNLVKSIYKLGIIGFIAYSTIRGSFDQLMILSRVDLYQSISIIAGIATRMTTRIVGTMLILAALDYAFQRYSYEKSIKMSKHEVKEEHKQSEGSPLLKSRIRARQRQIARQRMMEEVPAADVIITNPTHFAVALKYNADKSTAPVVVAKGQDILALKIREIAQQNDVPIVENPPLARALYKQVDIGREIPGELYEAVAEVLAFVYQINQKRKERMSFSMGGR